MFLSNCSFFECQGFSLFVARVTNDKRKVPRRCARVSISERVCFLVNFSVFLSLTDLKSCVHSQAREVSLKSSPFL